ncbi:MAG: DUF4229 domain-containing protein [Candidatus Nanopelagicales bacterium]|jgi:hypothetical protein|nr:DUF4229 domain-containing protein [Candidatus Nanopelagicales bacterium]
MSDPDTPAEPSSAAAESPSPAPAGPEPAQAAEATHDGPAAGPDLPEPVPHAGLRYALLRLLMLAAVGGILYVIGMRGWLLAFAAVLLSGLVSLFLLMKQRNDAAVNLERTVDGWKHRRDHEDAGLAPE